MLAIVVVAAATCVGSLVLGQAVLALCGALEWSWLAAPVGFASMIILAVPALHVPGRSAAMAALIATLIAGGVILLLRRGAHRPPVDLILLAPVALLALIPFIAAGRSGTLGVSINNDMGAHMLLVEAYRSQAVANITPLLAEYPLGPHALVAALVEGLGVRTDLAFAGVMVSGPVLLACTSLAAMRQTTRIGRMLGATIVGMPFLIAAFYGEGSFKEVFEAQFVLAAALIFAGFQPDLRARRWIPLAVVVAGAVSVYSVQGFVWPAAFAAVWLLVRGLASAWSRGMGEASRELRAELGPATLGVGLLVVLLVPQIPRIEKFISKGATNEISKNNLGNLVGPLPGWESLGVWGNPDFRFPPTTPFTAGMWTAFVLALVIVGVVWLLQRRRWMLPFAAGLALLIWAYAAHTQSPYISAKALTIASPLLMIIAVTPLIRVDGVRPRWWRWLAPILAVVLLARVADSSWEALRYSRVGPTDHLSELRSLRPQLRGPSTLFLGQDDFIRWELAGVRVTPAYINRVPLVPLRPQKSFQYGEPLDFDSVDVRTLNEFGWFITTRDAAGSEPPSGVRLVRTTRDYALWQRVGVIHPREILAEGAHSYAILDCGTPAGRALLRAGGVAAVRAPSVEAAVPPLTPGGAVTVTLQLRPGKWALESSYQSPVPLQVSGAGARDTLPANLDLLGPRWPIFEILAADDGRVSLTFHATRHLLTPESDGAPPSTVIATPVGSEHVVPISVACGKPVDWYRTA